MGKMVNLATGKKKMDHAVSGRCPASSDVGLVFDLLVRTDPNFFNFRLSCDGDWGCAQKIGKIALECPD
jgi:hypothetical protein